MLRRLSEIHPKIFNRICLAIAFVFLSFVISGEVSSPKNLQDFPQYYMGGVISYNRAFDALYPIPNPKSPRNPGFVQDSFMKRRYKELAEERGVGESVRYMQPPPFALFLTPFALLKFHTAHKLWNVILMLCAVCISWQAARIFTICLGRESLISGFIILMIALSPECNRWIRTQNMSPILGALIGVAALDLLREQTSSLRGMLSMWLGGIAKYAGAALVPLYFVKRKWMALIMLTALMTMTTAVSVRLMGWSTFDEFIHVIWPKLGRCTPTPSNQAIQALILRIMHQEIVPRTILVVLGIIQAIALLLILALLFIRPKNYWTYPPNIFAASFALVMWMLIFSPMYWEHYIAYTVPMWGWLTWEALQGRARRWILISALVMIYIPTPLLEDLHLGEPFISHFLWASCLMLSVAIWRLLQPIPIAAANGAYK
jgi:hypothetical protein